jgi:Leucine-rich repeat (LRR) protein
MKITYLKLLLCLNACTLSFDQGKKTEDKSPALAALALGFCEEAGGQRQYQELLQELGRVQAEPECDKLIERLGVVDYLDLSYFFAENPNLWEHIVFLQSFPEIIHLKLSANKLDDITPLAQLTQLRYLYLDRNEIKDLEPLRNLKLVWLDVANNQLTSLEPVLGMSSLQDLYAEDNPLAVAPEKSAWPHLRVLRF